MITIRRCVTDIFNTITQISYKGLVLNVSNFLFLTNIVNKKNYLWILCLIALFSLCAIAIDTSIIMSYYVYFLVFIFSAIIFIIPFSKTKALIISSLNRILGISALVLFITISIALYYDLNIQFSEAFKLSSQFVGIWCMYSIIISLLTSKINTSYIIYLFIGLIVLMFFNMLFVIVLSNIFMPIFSLFSAISLSLDCLHMNSSSEPSSSSTNNLDSSKGGGYNSPSGGDEHLVEYDSKCPACVAKSKIEYRLKFEKFNKKNIILPTDDPANNITRAETSAIADAMNKFVGREDYGIIKDSRFHDKEMLSRSGKYAPEGGLLSDNKVPGVKWGSVENNKDALARLMDYLDWHTH